jgi:hypothetical protein
MQPRSIKETFDEKMGKYVLREQLDRVLIFRNDDFGSFFYNITKQEAFGNSGYSGPYYCGTGETAKEWSSNFLKQSEKFFDGKISHQIDIRRDEWPDFYGMQVGHRISKEDFERVWNKMEWMHYKYENPKSEYMDYLFYSGYIHRDGYTTDQSKKEIINLNPILFVLGWIFFL